MVRIALRSADVDSLDPALSYSGRPACCSTRRARASSRSLRRGLVPEVAAAPPRRSRDGKTYTFTIRGGFRFSDGTPVRASAFARAIHRTLAPGVAVALGGLHGDIVGAERRPGGKAAAAAGVVARGNTLVVRLKRPVPDFAARTTSLCAVPPTLPADREGIGAFPAAGPYYVAEYRPARRVVIRRNPFYAGRRPHHVDGFAVDLRARLVRRRCSTASSAATPTGAGRCRRSYFDPSARLAEKYGVNRVAVLRPARLRSSAASPSTRRGRSSGTTRRLRQAVNFAIDRSALRRAGGRAAPEPAHRPVPAARHAGLPGRAHLPARAGPICARARALARGNTRSGKAVLFTVDSPQHARVRAEHQAEPREDRARGRDQGRSRCPRTSAGSARPAPTTSGSRPGCPTTPTRTPCSTCSSTVASSGDELGALRLARVQPTAPACRARSTARRATAPTATLDVRLARDAAPMVAVEVSERRRRSSRSGSAASRGRSISPRSASSSSSRRLHGDPDEPVGDGDAGRGAADVDRLARPRSSPGRCARRCRRPSSRPRRRRPRRRPRPARRRRGR